MTRTTGALMVLVSMSLCGCFSLGSTRLYEDQIGYSRALGDAEKSETLLNVVRMRYAEPPTVLQATQVISGYQLQRNITGGFEAFPAANANSILGSANNLLSGAASAQLQQSPTFTFQPLSGEQFARAFIRPLSPNDLLPLAMSGLPIDVLFRLGVQSANGLSNAVALSETGAAGSPDFFLLLYDLRRLQIAGLLGIRLQHEAAPIVVHPGAKSSAHGGKVPPIQEHGNSDPPVTTDGAGPAGSQTDSQPGRVYLSIAETPDPALHGVAEETKRLLAMPPGASQVEVVYGRYPAPGQVAVLTRSMLGVLSQLAIQIDVPPADVAANRTLPTVGNIGLEQRPVVIIHSGFQAPADVFAAVEYRKTWFWIAEDDFDSKLAFTVLQILLALARTGTAPGAILTIPAG
jgi:hypothetical protein